MRKAVLFFLALFCVAPLQTSHALDGKLRFEGGEIVLRLDDGRLLRREGLIGVRVLSDGSPRARTQLLIEGVADAVREPVVLYRVLVLNPSGRPPDNLCDPDPEGRRLALAIPDRGPPGFRFTCTSGAEGKCILMGYRPWEKQDGIALADYHRACVHMFRADYGGDDRPTTRNGTAINFWDNAGIQGADMKDGMEFEAAWGPEGALCVAHPRIPENISLAGIAETVPRLATHLGPEACRQDDWSANPRALLFNRSAAPRSGK